MVISDPSVSGLGLAKIATVCFKTNRPRLATFWRTSLGNGFSGFVAEVMKIVNQMQEGSDKPRHKVEFEVGEYVRVKEGPFTDFNGSVESVNYVKSRLHVSVTIFGRATPVELEFSQVEKV